MNSAVRLLFSAAIVALVFLAPSAAIHAAPPVPTQAEVTYGSHPAQVLDFYRAPSAEASPVLFWIHGGGWLNGDKKNPDFVEGALAKGVSVVSINYRLIPDAIAAKISPPVKACLDDAARALQFVRSKAGEWRIDKTRIAVGGGSAGGFSALWIAFHSDLADAQSSDPIARESTRVSCALCFVPQTSLDPVQMRQWIPNNDYGHHAFALPSMQAFIDQRAELLPWIERFSPYALATADDPPVYLFYDSVPAMGQPVKEPPHSANFGAGLVEKLKSLGIEYEFNYPAGPAVKHPDMFAFVLEKLKVAPPK